MQCWRSPFAFSSLFCSPLALPEVARNLKLVFIFALSDFMIWPRVRVAIEHRGFFCAFRVPFSDSALLVRSLSFLVNLVSHPSYPFVEKEARESWRRLDLSCFILPPWPFPSVTLSPILTWCAPSNSTYGFFFFLYSWCPGVQYPWLLFLVLKMNKLSFSLP